jgi:hypothetical protein
MAAVKSLLAFAQRTGYPFAERILTEAELGQDH